MHALWGLWYFTVEWTKYLFLVGFKKVSNISWLVLYTIKVE